MGVGHTPTASQRNMFDLEKLTIFSCGPDGVQARVTCHSLESNALPIEPPHHLESLHPDITSMDDWALKV